MTLDVASDAREIEKQERTPHGDDDESQSWPARPPVVRKGRRIQRNDGARSCGFPQNAYGCVRCRAAAGGKDEDGRWADDDVRGQQHREAPRGRQQYFVGHRWGGSAVPRSANHNRRRFRGPPAVHRVRRHELGDQRAGRLDQAGDEAEGPVPGVLDRLRQARGAPALHRPGRLADADEHVPGTRERSLSRLPSSLMTL